MSIVLNGICMQCAFPKVRVVVSHWLSVGLPEPQMLRFSPPQPIVDLLISGLDKNQQVGYLHVPLCLWLVKLRYVFAVFAPLALQVIMFNVYIAFY